MSKKQKKTRIDSLLVEQSLAKDLKQAQAFILAGKVVVNDQRVSKASELFSDSSSIRLKIKEFVSRGGLKLNGAIEQMELQDLFKMGVVLDIGASTGGFTHCALSWGAKSVLAVELGQNQLDWSLRNDARVMSLEKTDIRTFDAQGYPEISIVVGDISFNSLSNLASTISRIGSKGCYYLLLVKPQFELSSKEVPDGGVVESEDLRNKAVKLVLESFASCGLKFLKSCPSKVKGKMGNQEIFVLFRKE